MIEALIAAGVGIVLLAVAGGEEVAGLLYLAGAGAVALGLGAGVPAGIVYHLLLRRALAARGALERGWIWRPTSYHDRLPEPARRAVLSWFRAGAAGFLLVVAGCGLVLAAILAR